MIVIGLTGGVGMGKSTVASQLARFGAKICSADAIVHRLLAKGGAAVEAVGSAFPGVVRDGAVDRKALGEIVFSDRKKLRKLEQLLHPLVVAREERFVAEQRALGAKCVVLDIPLLFETGAQARCDVTIAVTAPYVVQKQRVMRRKGMTEEKFHAIVRSQMPDEEKRRLADYVVPTGQGRAVSYRHVAAIMKGLYEA